MDVGTVIFFLIVVGIPIIAGTVGKLFKEWLRHKQVTASALNAQTAEKAAQYAAHVERLEERVRVLERIVTDKGVGLAGEIEALRDPPRLEKPLN